MDMNHYVYDEAKEIISNYLRLKEGELQPDSHIVNEMGADSLALAELRFQISEKSAVPIVDTSDEKLVFKNLVAYIEEHMPEQVAKE